MVDSLIPLQLFYSLKLLMKNHILDNIIDIITIKFSDHCNIPLLIGFANSTDVFPVYIGDDRTDEDAFKVSYV